MVKFPGNEITRLPTFILDQSNKFDHVNPQLTHNDY